MRWLATPRSPFVNGHGETLGWLAPTLGQHAARHLAQARHALDEGKRLVLARKFVEGRARNHRALLRRLNRERNDAEVLKALTELMELLGQLKLAGMRAAMTRWSRREYARSTRFSASTAWEWRASRL